MDSWGIIAALASVIGTLAGFIALQFKGQLAAKDAQLATKDERIADKDKQIVEGKAREERLLALNDGLGKSVATSIEMLTDIQDTAESIARELDQRPERSDRPAPRRTGGR